MKKIKSLFRRAKAHKINKIDLAKEAGCHVTTFDKWLDGTTDPGMNKFAGVEKALDLLIEQKALSNDGA